MQSKEQKVGELIANSVEDHWFNPASLGHYLSQQPLWTIDRVMEVVMWVIEKNARRAEDEAVKGSYTEGLNIAYKLDEVINQMKKSGEYNNVKIP